LKNSKVETIAQLRWIGIAEGISFLVLLLIAMPLKYVYDYPLPVKYTGWAHGLLFILYVGLVFKAAFTLKWNLLRIGLFLIASFIPLATFFLDSNLKKEQKTYL
jgi:integral membrane protein